jgi:hypothetical protein
MHRSELLLTIKKPSKVISHNLTYFRNKSQTFQNQSVKLILTNLFPKNLFNDTVEYQALLIVIIDYV